MLFLTLLPFMAKAQNTQNSEDGKKIRQGKTGKQGLSARNTRNNPGQIRIPDHYGRRTFRSEKRTCQRYRQCLADCCLQSRNRPVGRRKHQNARCLRTPVSGKRVDSDRRADARAFYHRRTPITPPAIFCQPLVHSQAGGQRTRCRYHTGIYLPTDLPITIEGGLYNGSGLTNQKNGIKK